MHFYYKTIENSDFLLKWIGRRTLIPGPRLLSITIKSTILLIHLDHFYADDTWLFFAISAPLITTFKHHIKVLTVAILTRILPSSSFLHSPQITIDQWCWVSLLCCGKIYFHQTCLYQKDVGPGWTPESQWWVAEWELCRTDDLFIRLPGVQLSRSDGHRRRLTPDRTASPRPAPLTVH